MPDDELTMNVLLIEDSRMDALVVRTVLQDSEMGSFVVEWESTLAAGVQRLKASGADAVLLDLHLPDSMGLETFKAVYRAAPEIPILVLSGLSDDDIALEAVRSGAQDYLVKGAGDQSIARALGYAVERRRLQTELDRLREEQLAIKNRFLSHVSHELRSPLAATHQFLTIVLDNLAGELNSEQREYLEIALDNVEQLGDMIGDLLDASRVETGKLRVDRRRMSMAGIFAEVHKSFRAEAGAKGISISASASPDLPEVYADPRRVRQILSNLVDNALKFTPAGGWVRMRAVEADDPDYVTVAVADSGCGIAQGDEIFQRLYQEKTSVERSRNGLGIGLYICRELVSCHGGRIWVESEPGEGSTFFLTLPVCSLQNLLWPVLAVGDPATSRFAVARVGVRTSEGRRLDAADEAVISELFRSLSSAVRAHEVVLPRCSGRREESFLVVSGRDQQRPESLVERVQRHLRESIAFARSGLEADVSLTVLDDQEGSSSAREEAPSGARMEWLVRHIDRLMPSCTDERSNEHETAEDPHGRGRQGFSARPGLAASGSWIPGGEG